MSDTYVVAARLRLQKKAVTAWLRSPWPEDGRLAWPAKPALKLEQRAPRSIRHGLAQAVDEAASHDLGLVAAWEGLSRSFLLYHVMIGWQPEAVARTLLAIAACAEHWTHKNPTHALLVSETGAKLWTEGVMAMLEVGPAGARFVSLDPAAAVAVLAPAEARWNDALKVGMIDAMHDPSFLQPQIRQLAQHPLLKRRKQEVPVFETLEAWLAAISAVKLVGHGNQETCETDYESWGRFEHDIIRYAQQARRFGPKIAPSLTRLLKQPSWEPGVIAFWALNQLSIEVGDPSHYLEALTLWRTWSEAGQGWARGEVTVNEELAAKSDHQAALAGTPYSSRDARSLIASDETLDAVPSSGAR